MSKLDPKDLLGLLAKKPRAQLAQLPTPLHPLVNFTKAVEACNLWIKRDDLTGLEGGGNKTRKLEFLLGEAIEQGADTIVTAGAIQSNHTRQTAAAAAKLGLRCALLHFGWTKDPGSAYRKTGNILLSDILGAELYIDDKRRPIEDQSPLYEFEETLKRDGRKTYLVPNGASEHPLGGLGYMACAAEIAIQAFGLLGKQFDHIVHCTGSSSTQAGLLAGFAAMGLPTKITGIADDGETEIKRQRIHRLANDTLAEMKIAAEVPLSAVEVVAARDSAYGESDPEIFDVIHRFARAEGLVVDPVYEGNAVLGLLTLGKAGSFGSDSNVLLMHLGGSPAVHAYSDVFGTPELVAWPKVP